MKCYIYFIINQTTKCRYVGQTTNFSRRKNEHLSKLRENKHPNQKLQSSWNKYGESNFIFEKIVYDNLSKEELNEQEKMFIQKYDSYNNGYNLTLGGDGGATRSKLDFDDFCLAYFCGKKYQGMTNQLGKYLGVDSSCISAIIREKSYDQFRQQALMLSDADQEKYLDEAIQLFNLDTDIPWTKMDTPDDKLTLKILCVASNYGRGIESCILQKFGLSKGFLFHFRKGSGRQNIKDEYTNLTDEEIKNIGQKYYSDWELEKFAKVKIKEQFHRIIEVVAN